eukprot:TRINITY_DN10777_c0_g1_i1.p4 TRINITY_DN10777_c0_g1~~TRINITY_DN10777_c0_g1_i1.p4  ORF type:complete len:112 (-),score=5.89 TRINITY_DN10777_c0_g1_i1:1229-1564(-)
MPDAVEKIAFAILLGEDFALSCQTEAARPSWRLDIFLPHAQTRVSSLRLIRPKLAVGPELRIVAAMGAAALLPGDEADRSRAVGAVGGEGRPAARAEKGEIDATAAEGEDG